MRALVNKYSVACSIALGVALFATQANASGECVSGNCGTPTQSGGGCGCGCSILVAMTDRGDTYQFADDQDGDGVEDDFDNCPFISNFDQADDDGDQVGNSCDNCATSSNTIQADANSNGIGDACDPDADSDGIPNGSDNCPFVYNLNQLNSGGLPAGDACDSDDDGDGIPDVQDPCRLQATGTTDGPCDDDVDGDGVAAGGTNNKPDNCPEVANANQSDTDGDGIGDACDQDQDGDGVENFRDNCVAVANPGQVDADNDGLGDAGNFQPNDGFESCDHKECYVVDRASYASLSTDAKESSCLDPSRAFDTRIGVAGPDALANIRVGDTIQLRDFTNRLGVVHSWSASFTRSPDGSSAVLDNAIGSASTYPGSFQIGSDPRVSTIQFKADKAGTYEILVSTSLVNGDPLGLPASTSSQRVSVTVGEDDGGSSGGCSSTQAEVSLAALAFGLFLVGFIRRMKA